MQQQPRAGPSEGPGRSGRARRSCSTTVCETIGCDEAPVVVTGADGYGRVWHSRCPPEP